MDRRDFVRRSALWAIGALIAEPYVKRLSAFPVNPLVRGCRKVPPGYEFRLNKNFYEQKELRRMMSGAPWLRLTDCGWVTL